MFDLVDLIALNEEEAERLSGISFQPGQINSFADSMLTFLDASYPNLRVIVSAGRHGAFAFHRREWNHCAAPGVEVKSTAGAGDALLGGIIAGLAAGIPLLRPGVQALGTFDEWETALELGVLLASYTVQSQHTIHPEACLETVLGFARSLGIRAAPSSDALVQA